MTYLTDIVKSELKERGYNLLYTKSFSENYQTASYILVMKDNKQMITRFTYCSCSGIWEETSQSIIRSLHLLTHDKINTYAETVYIRKEDQKSFLHKLHKELRGDISTTIDIVLKENDVYTVLLNEDNELELVLLEP